MIHVDMEKEYLEFEGSGETMIKEMAMVLAMTLSEEALPDDETTDRVVDMITGSIGIMVKGALSDLREHRKECKDHEERAVQEERNTEEIRTVFKQYRRRRPC